MSTLKEDGEVWIDCITGDVADDVVDVINDNPFVINGIEVEVKSLTED